MNKMNKIALLTLSLSLIFSGLDYSFLIFLHRIFLENPSGSLREVIVVAENSMFTYDGLFITIIVPTFLLVCTYAICSLFLFFSSESSSRSWLKKSFWFSVPAFLLSVFLMYIQTQTTGGGGSQIGAELLYVPSLIIYLACILWTPIYLYRNRKK
jgi:hypothetical protein